MGMTKIVASLMLSTALLPAMLSKADTTATPSSNQETVESASATTGATNESTVSGTANQTHLVITSASAASQSTSVASSAASVAPSAVAQSTTSGTTASQTSSSSVKENNSTSQAQATSATSADQTSTTTSTVVQSAALSATTSAATTNTLKNDASASASSVVASATSAQTSVANAASATADKQDGASQAAATSEATTAKTNSSATKPATTPAPATPTNNVQPATKPAATPAPATPTNNAQPAAKPADTPVPAELKDNVQPAAKPVATPAPVKPTDKIQPAEFTPEADQVTTRVSHNQHFLNEIKPGAISGWHKYRVLPSVTAAQAILESGWGDSQLAKIGNNLFGIKGSYNGQSIYFYTQEWNGHQYVTVNAAFRKYPNWAASVEDHGAFLVENSRYRNLLGVTDYRKVATLLQQDGYATSPTYASLLISIINSNRLYDWDREAISGQNVVNPGNNNQNQVVPESGRYTFKHTTAIHTAADTNSPVVGSYDAGESVYYNAKIESNGQTWLQYLSYSGSNHYVMIKAAKPVAPTTPNQTLPSSGSYTFKANTNIRNGASKGAAVVGHYDAGQTVNYNGTVQADGLTWLRYVSYSGATHYVATSGDDVVAAPEPHVENVSGSYQFTRNTAIKSAPTNQSNTVGTYNAGERVYYNAKVTVGNQTWLRYVSYSGATHYVEVAAAGNVNTNTNAVVTPATGAYRFTHTTAIKTAADRNAGTVGTYYAGNTVYYNAKVTVNGQTWLRYQSYSGANHYVEIGAVTGQPDQVTSQKGSFRFTTTTNIRTAPTTHAAVVGEYYAGDVVYYDGTVKAEGYTWLRYMSRSGAVHYAAIVH